ncbi:RagB/SusD family nutrient uptake outer membrane protein [Solitalea canadensis]|uniref:RagB/SusD family protein n=1 Tax=Solitalea canadensis (strain ATCC 29591 / DSM 3403 / JCM 21819 / LMG 8368 / NBRC 15130 / NCIMB 12057 / USAM 9D) TaxID=929556 RepID=H8KQH1_SOLCM|nr:RagB/SusD family nutrient uptake outer membrane protein [Solitalea canadensis]AFD06587.1 RagB/SusD family protein [Solitalea canadensis DSM 3403]
MKNKIYTIVLALSFLAGLSACEKDFLDRKPLDTYSELDVWTDINLVQTYVNSKYRAFPHVYNWDVASGTGLSAAADEGYSKFNYENVFSWNKGTITPDNLSMDSWSTNYGYIRDCNTFFEKIGGVSGDENLKKRLIGEMKMIRAWCYFDLVTRFGGVPIITKSYTLTDTAYMVKRNTYAECMNFITTELNETIALLPESYSGIDEGRITKGAALALKSRALLYAASPLNNPSNDKAKWQAAADAAKAVIDLAAQGEYQLYQGNDYKQIFLQKFNSEIILSFGMNGTNWESVLDIFICPNGYHGWSVYAPSQNLVDAFQMSNGKSITDPTSGYNPSKPYENRDPRFYASVLYNGADFKGRKAEYFKGGMDSPQSPVENWNATLTGYNWRKYADESNDLNTTGSSQNWIIFRLTEMYLNYAEAQVELGNEAEALQYLNLVRNRNSVKMPAVAATGDALQEAIQLEREIEFCFEGHRFFDVRRWKIAMQTENKPLRAVNITKNTDGTFNYEYYTLQQRTFKEANYLFPIPQYEREKNKLLTQNPLY